MINLRKCVEKVGFFFETFQFWAKFFFNVILCKNLNYKSYSLYFFESTDIQFYLFTCDANAGEGGESKNVRRVCLFIVWKSWQHRFYYHKNCLANSSLLHLPTPYIDLVSRVQPVGGKSCLTSLIFGVFVFTVKEQF